jgi:hypothetical protein
MKIKTLPVSLVVIILLTVIAIACKKQDENTYTGERTVGLMVNNSTKVYNGYTLFAPKQNTMTFLINNDGRIIHKWTASKYPPEQVPHRLRDPDRREPGVRIKDRRHGPDFVFEPPDFEGPSQKAVGPAAQRLIPAAGLDKGIVNGDDRNVPGQPENADHPQGRRRPDDSLPRGGAVYALEKQDAKMDALAPDGREDLLRCRGLMNIEPPGLFGKDLLQARPELLLDGGCAMSDEDIDGRAKQSVHGRNVLNHRLSARSGIMFNPSAEGRDFLKTNVRARPGRRQAWSSL